MFGTKSEYDRGVNTFSPEGRLFQVEYALGAIKLGSTAVGIQTKEGVVLAVERRLASPMMEPSSIEKIMEIDTHVGCAMSGLTADARTLVDHARVETQNHWFTYNEKMPVESAVHAISDLALDFSDVGDSERKKVMSRPFGVALLVAGVDDENGPQLWNADPSGMYTRFSAAAIGSAHEGAEGMLHEQYNQSMSLKEAEDLALVILRQVMEEQLNSRNVEMACITAAERKFRIYSSTELLPIIERLPAPTLPTALELAQRAS
uniref:Proteasome subunit alpha type n=1 Tax=Chromera velia CCMP2878 TaxID=1169474 RepID=A0A0G4I646_9ALVE|mmetsp:Transcript_42598/g.83995  ORF Transcript_42598/g.83995 Transcript_42598/m.83995 type:complete len:262 (-) Transcript_42598:749-1534(-)|eukprot:Cvel_11300.t1-p1 / transcript=Cvel_11300.t1 / gene=Cvel_11300 / organism=Chromera_velia_CCMP2878 / gene_product=Proteasome subunit alpha type-5, putative / transcript_product=Proteasome subunit alpha type-5, putative / location=Cvel_scaffold706:40095-43734(+) / protein_length=261 / sequence_SO=supercontig / SO=protein_coding / is_pseudo=false